jgi:hypothetical protein
VTDAAIHRVSGDLDGNADRFLRASGSPRPQGARDDKVKEVMVVGTMLSLRGGRQDDAAIHRVPGERTGLAVRLLVYSGSPRASPSR